MSTRDDAIAAVDAYATDAAAQASAAQVAMDQTAEAALQSQLAAAQASLTAAQATVTADGLTIAGDDDTITALKAQVATLEAQLAAIGAELPGAPPGGRILVGSTFGSGIVAQCVTRLATYLTVSKVGPGSHRSYYQANEIAKAQAMATWDLQHGMLPWLSFKLPDTWAAMATDSQNAWYASLNAMLKTLPGPVWVTLHHEPENDQYSKGATGTQRPGYLPSDFKAMYVHGRPLIKAGLINVAVGPIFMHGGVLGTSFGGQWTPAALGVDSSWADFFGVDAYVNKMQAVQPDEGPTLTALAAAIKPTGLLPALAEYGYSDTSYAAGANPGSIGRAVAQAVSVGFLVVGYFDSDANSVKNWILSGARLADWGASCDNPQAIKTVTAA